MPLVQGHRVEWRVQTKPRFLDPMIQRAAFFAQRAVADPNVIEIDFDFESNSPAMT